MPEDKSPSQTYSRVQVSTNASAIKSPIISPSVPSFDATYLYDAKYLAFNPLSLFRNKSMNKGQEEQRLKPLERILEDDEWTAILATLKNLPESLTAEIFYK